MEVAFHGAQLPVQAQAELPVRRKSKRTTDCRSEDMWRRTTDGDRWDIGDLQGRGSGYSHRRTKAAQHARPVEVLELGPIEPHPALVVVQLRDEGSFEADLDRTATEAVGGPHCSREGERREVLHGPGFRPVKSERYHVPDGYLSLRGGGSEETEAKEPDHEPRYGRGTDRTRYGSSIHREKSCRSMEQTACPVAHLGMSHSWMHLRRPDLRQGPKSVRPYASGK